MARRRFHATRGSALMLALAVLGLVLALAGASVPLAVTERTVSANHVRSVRAFYAAETMLAWVTSEAATIEDWSAWRTGQARSRLQSRRGVHVVPGATVDLLELTAPGVRGGPYRPSDPASRRWRLWADAAWSRLWDDDAPGSRAVGADLFVLAAWVADDGVIDGAVDELVVHVAAHGPRATHRAVRATLVRVDAVGVVVRAWREAG